jgi:membrane associated rhomboid family serine protease
MFTVSLGLIVFTSVISLFAFSSRTALIHFAECPYEVLRYGRWYQLITSGFLHADLGHLFMNMFTLYFFGPYMERVLGAQGFVILYFGSMLAGSLLTLATRYRDPNYRAIGASGAISGVLFGFILLRPLAPIYIFFIPIPIPAILFAFGYLAVSLFGMRARWGRIGHEAHLGGAIGGLILTLAMFPRALGIFLSHFH